MGVVDKIKQILNRMKGNKPKQLVQKDEYSRLVESIDDIELADMFVKKVTPEIENKINNLPYLPYEYQYQTKVTKDQAFEIAKNFFKTIDQNYAVKVEEILDGKNSDINLEIVDASTTNEGPNLSNPNIKPLRLFLPQHGNIQDVYDMVHECTHTLDIDNGDNVTRRVLGEVAPPCMERLLDTYLLNLSDEEKQKYGFNNEALIKDIEDRRFCAFATRYNNVKMLHKRQGNRELDSRYMLAQIYSAEFDKMNEADKKNAIVKFISNVEGNDFEKANEAFGMKIDKQYALQRENYIANCIDEVDPTKVKQTTDTPVIEQEKTKNLDIDNVI